MRLLLIFCCFVAPVAAAMGSLPVAKAAKELLAIFACGRSLADPTRAACMAVLARVRSALEAMSRAALRESCEALLSHHRSKYPIDQEQTYQRLAQLTRQHARGRNGAIHVSIHAAAAGDLGDVMRAAWAEDAALPTLCLSLSDLIPGQGPGVLGIADDGCPLLATGEPAAAGAKDVVAARNCFYDMYTAFLTLSAMAYELKHDGLFVIGLVKQQVAPHHHPLTTAPPPLRHPHHHLHLHPRQHLQHLHAVTHTSVTTASIATRLAMWAHSSSRHCPTASSSIHGSRR